MRVLDFDNTIYDGESPLDFYLFSLRYNPGNICLIFPVLFHMVRYRFSRCSREDMERAFRKYVTGYIGSFDDIPGMVQAFWNSHGNKIKGWYTPRPDDVIITASFNYTMDEIVRRLGVGRCICSTIDYATGELVHLNFGDNKVKAFREEFGDDAVPDEYYTDNLVDLPMMQLAKRAYLVKGNDVIPYDPWAKAPLRRDGSGKSGSRFSS